MKTAMKRKLLIAFSFISVFLNAQQESTEVLSEEEQKQIEAFQKYSDSISSTFNYKYGSVQLKNDLATLEVPKGYKFVDQEDANRILVDIWGNPKEEGTLGMLLKDDETPVTTSYAIEISYSEEGYVSDEEANEIDYDELLEQMQEDTNASNKERTKLGYPTIDLVGWASAPYYDEEEKKLHWAKELKFEDYETNTLNYNIRVLGRKGYLNLNVIGNMDVLQDVKHNLNPILKSVAFNEGNKYSDFNPDIDKVAAYGIGGLVAGKVLAKAGVFALLAKYAKVIFFGLAAAFGAFKNKIFGRKEEEA